jgi:LemA protein
MLGTILLLVIVGGLVLWLIGAYNGLIALKNQVANGFKQIDVQLERRHDLITSLVETVKGAMQFERDALEAVITARNQAVKAQGSGSVPAIAAAEQQLTGALGRLLVVVEAYPDLKATRNVAQLQEELVSTENRVAFARQHYNDVVTQYNTRQAQFPTSLVAGLATAAPADLWEIEDTTKRTLPKVDLSLRPAPRV